MEASISEQAFGVDAGEPADAGYAATLVLKLGYRGAGFSGFAEQEGQRTVAGELRRALETFLRRPVELTCAGRTDAGVHAIGQMASLGVTAEERERLSAHRLLVALGALTPDDLAIRSVFAAPPGFSARFGALERRYRYRIATGPEPALLHDFAWWHPRPLDVGAMAEAAPQLLGERDFKSFCKASSAEGKPTMRCLRELCVSRTEELGEEIIAVDVAASSFLHTMVRTIVGSLALIGEGLREPAWLGEALAARDRRAAGPTAPAEGLTFQSVAYPEGLLQPWEPLP